MPIIRALEKTGWTVFWDRTIPISKTWQEVVGIEVEACHSMIVAWSQVSIHKEWVYEEAGEGKRRKILFPVLIDNVTPPLGFRSIQAADLTGWDGESPKPAFDRLVADLSSILGQPSSTQQPDIVADIKKVTSHGVVTSHSGRLEEGRAPLTEPHLGHRRDLTPVLTFAGALALASSIFMTVGGGPLMFGIPIFGFLGFLIALIVGMWCLVLVLPSDKGPSMALKYSGLLVVAASIASTISVGPHLFGLPLFGVLGFVAAMAMALVGLLKILISRKP